MWANPTFPNLPDFLLFVQNVMAIDPLYLPLTSPYQGYALKRAIALVIPGCGGVEYTIATYNCAGHYLVTAAPDQTGRTFFQNLRQELGVTKLSAGVIQSASDESTSETLAVPDAVRQLTIGDLGFMKTPWGREYLAYAQDFGQPWGLS